MIKRAVRVIFIVFLEMLVAVHPLDLGHQRQGLQPDPKEILHVFLLTNVVQFFNDILLVDKQFGIQPFKPRVYIAH